jgi:hypothetical protein
MWLQCKENKKAFIRIQIIIVIGYNFFVPYIDNKERRLNGFQSCYAVKVVFSPGFDENLL